MDWLKSLFGLKSGPGALALFGGGVIALLARKAGLLDSELEFVVAFLAAFGFWLLVGLAVKGIYKMSVSAVAAMRARRREIAAQTAAEETAGAQREIEDADAAAARQRSIRNLDHLEPAEHDALFWIQIQEGHRARASINDAGINGLYNMGLLVPEDRDQLPTDRTWVIPDDLIEAVREKVGEPGPNDEQRMPPWQRRR